MRLQFAEGLLDRVEARRIRRKIKQRRARRFDRLAYAGDLVRFHAQNRNAATGHFGHDGGGGAEIQTKNLMPPEMS